MIRRSPRSTRTDTLFPYTTICRTCLVRGSVSRLFRWAERQLLKRSDLLVVSSPGFDRHYFRSVQGYRGRLFLLENKIRFAQASAVARTRPRPEERRVGKECVSPCRSRWSPYT